MLHLQFPHYVQGFPWGGRPLKRERGIGEGEGEIVLQQGVLGMGGEGLYSRGLAWRSLAPKCGVAEDVLQGPVRRRSPATRVPTPAAEKMGGLLSLWLLLVVRRRAGEG